MARRKIEKDASKIKNPAISKLMNEPPKGSSSKKTQRLVSINNVERRKAEGWKVIEAHKDKKQLSGSDLVLMER